MRKKLSVALAIILSTAMLAACGSSGAPAGGASAPAEPEKVEEAVEETVEEGAEAVEGAVEEGAEAVEGAVEAGEAGAEAAVTAAEAAVTAAETAAEVVTDGRTFTVGFDAEYPPYGYKDEETGDYTGFDLEMAEELCKRRGWQLVKQPIDWDSKDMELSSGAIDCIWNGMTYTGRENDYTWSDPYVDNSIVIAVSADSDVQTAEDLAGKIVVAQAGSSAYTALTNDPGDGSNDENLALAASFANLEQITDYNNAFMQMNAGVYDAVAVDIGVAMYQLNAPGNEGKYRLLEKPISTEQYAIAFVKGNTELRDLVQETFDEMAADGTVLKIAQKYADSQLPEMLIKGKE